MSEKEVTREITEPEELQAEEEKCATAADSQLNIAPAEQSSESFEILAEIFQKLKENEADLEKWNKHIRERLTELESLLRQKEAENEKLLVEISILEGNENFLNQQKKSLAAELADLKSFTKKKEKELRNLFQEGYELDCRVDDDEHTKEAQLSLLTVQINTVQRLLHNLYEGITDFLDQNSHTVAMLTQVKSHRDKLKRKTLQDKEAVQNLKNEIKDAEYQIMMTDETIQDLKDHLSLFQKKLADSEETMNPAAEPPPNSGFPVPNAYL